MNRLFVTFLLPGVARSGGVRVTVDMANRLLDRGHGVRIAFPKRPLLGAHALRGALSRAILSLRHAEESDWTNRFRGEWSPFRSIRDLTFRPGECVVAVGTGTVEWLRELAGPLVKVRYCHGLRPDQPELEKAAFGFPMHTLTVSSTTIPRLRALGAGDSIHVIPNGIDRDEYFLEDRPRQGIGAILSPAPLKAPEMILDLSERMRVEFPDVPWFVFGPPPRLRRMRAGVYEIYPSVAKAREIYNRCRVWLLPSLTEGFPAPILEAMACGCAVVSTATDGGRELISHGENGFLVPVGDAEAFMRHIRLLLRDENLCARIVANGLKTVARYDWNESATMLINWLSEFSRSVDSISTRP
ncbi:MAG: glycosyltransferase family 4 protein [Candidatus Sumerlaeota bacterium]|nr:glycosyltransferase family 4 protein [Candidatus Sumerlaeota bacterium]